MEYAELADLDPAATLAAVEERLSARRVGEVADMLLVLRWCDLHSGDPQAQPGAVPPGRGGDRLLLIGGEGTPEVSELCFAELAVARGAGMIATENYAAAVLDLRHRLPLPWAAVQRLEVEGWVARKIAKDSRKLGRDAVGIVDAAVAAAALESPGRQLGIAEAKIIEADPEAHRARLEEDARKTGVWLSKVRPGDTVDEISGEPATRRVSAKLPAGSAVRCDENVDDLAVAIYEHTPPDAEGNRPTHAECRLAAFEMLTTDPHKAAAFLDELDDEQPTDQPAPAKPPKRKRRPAEIVVHLTDRALCHHIVGNGGVARVAGMGPMLLDQLGELLEGRELLVQPVINLATITSVNAYEHPTAVKKRTVLRTLGDVFPHSTSRGVARLDHDHAEPWDPDGPAGQTGDLNDAPLTRTHHRAKTHLNYEVRQLGLGAYRWITPHGLGRVVTPVGTKKVGLIRGDSGHAIGEIYPGPRVDYHPRR
jgi:hypothetical protein